MVVRDGDSAGTTLKEEEGTDEWHPSNFLDLTFLDDDESPKQVPKPGSTHEAISSADLSECSPRSTCSGTTAVISAQASPTSSARSRRTDRWVHSVDGDILLHELVDAMRARRKEARAAGWIVSGGDAALRINDDQDADVEELRVSQVPGKGLVPSSAREGFWSPPDVMWWESSL